MGFPLIVWRCGTLTMDLLSAPRSPLQADREAGRASCEPSVMTNYGMEMGGEEGRRAELARIQEENRRLIEHRRAMREAERQRELDEEAQRPDYFSLHYQRSFR